jgi:hypothetical protein
VRSYEMVRKLRDGAEATRWCGRYEMETKPAALSLASRSFRL